MLMLSPVAEAASGPRLQYDGGRGRLFRLALTNTVLTLLTLGIYRFWGKTRIRGYLWGHLRLDGDRLQYTGTGRELFLGFLIVVVVLAPLSFGIEIARTALLSVGAWAAQGFNSAVLLAFWFLLNVAVFRARRYRLTRTTWRAIRGGQTGSSLAYGGLVLLLWAFTILTLGFGTALRRIWLTGYLTNRTWFGDRKFVFDGRGRDMLWRWAAAWLLLLPTLGYSYFWYRAAEARYVASRTRFGDLRFECALRPARLARIFAPYGACLGFLLGLVIGVAVVVLRGWADAPVEQLMAQGLFVGVTGLLAVALLAQPLYYAFVVHGVLAYFVETLEISGELEPDRLAQAQAPSPARGEGLAAALDLGGI